MAGGLFNSILILDAIPEGEFNTAKKLQEDLQDIADYHAEGLEVLYWKIVDREDLKECAAKIQSEVPRGLLPWFHLEGHGLDDESGFEFANRSPCLWKEFKEIITPINVATNLNVVVILATCFGGAFAGAIEVTDRAPVRALIGPKREIEIGEIHLAFPAFYKTLFNNLSFDEALHTLDEETSSGQYYRTSAINFFYDVWANYKIHMCTDDELEARAKKLRKTLKADDSVRTPGVAAIKRMIISQEEDVFNKYRDKYFLYDLDEGNRERFPVTYELAQLRMEEVRQFG